MSLHAFLRTETGSKKSITVAVTHLVGKSSFLLMQMACPLQYHWLS